MSLAPAAYLLFQKVMRRDPSDNEWIGRDRFILSAGHSSLTQYVQLYYGGYGLELDDLKALRTWGSKTPGHPEYGHTDGVEITTGPLGQGTLLGRRLRLRRSATSAACSTRMPRPAPARSTTTSTSIASDGDLEEGITQRGLARSPATSSSATSSRSTTATRSRSRTTPTSPSPRTSRQRYEAYDWHVQTVDWKKTGVYVEDVAGAVRRRSRRRKAETDKPSLIILKTIIGWPRPKKQNTGKIHGSALGADELRRRQGGARLRPREDLRRRRRGHRAHPQGDRARRGGARRVAEGRSTPGPRRTPSARQLLDRILTGALPEGVDDALPVFEAGKDVSTRAASGKVLSALGAGHPRAVGRLGRPRRVEQHDHRGRRRRSSRPSTRRTSGPATRTAACCTSASASTRWARSSTGIVLHGNTRPFGGTFLIFSDYMRPAVRLAALMKAPSIFVWTHDSVALGEDGPTHQPIEQLTALRAIPGLDIVRPADANEVAWAWKTILERRKGPAGIALSRQNMPVFERGDGDADGRHLRLRRRTSRRARTCSPRRPAARPT